MMNLLAVAENYPELKADQTFNVCRLNCPILTTKLLPHRFLTMPRMVNTAIQQFPAVVVVRMFGFQEQNFFEMTEEEVKNGFHTARVQF